MKKNNILLAFLAVILFFGACSDFEEINKDPNAANEDDIKVQYIINKAITDAQQDPHIAERAFVLYWRRAGRQDRSSGINLGTYNNDWSSDYYSYVSGWMKSATQAVDLADKQLEKDNFAVEYDRQMTKNLKEVARIWRVYLMSEFADNFGPLPIEAFKGKNPEFASVKDVYYFMLDELKDATQNIDPSLQVQDIDKKFDRAYQLDFTKWTKYANSMRMRLAMRLSEVDPEKAKSEFEDAAKGSLILTENDMFAVQERDGWDPLAGVMSRPWNALLMSNTLNNLMINLGGVKSEDMLDASYAAHIKPEGYMGIRLQNQFSTYTNDPSIGFFFDGLHNTIDPRAYKLYAIPGDFSSPDAAFTSEDDLGSLEVSVFADKEQTQEIGKFNMAFTWNTMPGGSWGDKSAMNQMISSLYNPILVKKYRNHSQKRVFFAAWETYFLLAEASLRGWSTPIAAKQAYENGIKASLEYHGVGEYFDTYIASTDYNRVGTSVNWDHTAEPPTTVEVDIIDGYTKQPAKYAYKFPTASQTSYQKALNDQLTKVITQKFIAQNPWLPLETWSDYRRLGLPFFENMVVENPLTDLPALTRANASTTQQPNFFPQRLKYPASLENSNPDGYRQAVELLGGSDAVLTPLWWAKH